MVEFTAEDFEDLCRAGAVRSQIDTIEERRARAVRRFWLILAVSLLLGAVVLFSLIRSGWPIAGIVLGLIVLAVGLAAGLHPLTAAKDDLKLPVLETLAERGGMEYLPDGFDPPVMPSAAQPLFGRVTSATFTDLFHGTDPDGRRFAVYEGTLSRKQGKNSETIFRGQIYAFQRRSTRSSEIVIVPDAGLFNFLHGKSGMERVKFEGDPEFDSAFEVYATQPAAALGELDPALRRKLAELRRSGKLVAYLGREDVLVALWGEDRFEPGSMFRSRPGRERARLMFDDVCASMGILRALRAAID